MLAYAFGVKGQHTEILFTPPDTPEPATFLLMGAALLLPLLKKVGRRIACGVRLMLLSSWRTTVGVGCLSG